MAASLVICAVVVLVLYANSGPGPSDTASGTINDATLEAQTLPPGLPMFGTRQTTTDTDAMVLFNQIEEAERWVNGGINDPAEIVENSQGLAKELIALGETPLKNGVMDERIPDKQFVTREFNLAMATVSRGVQKHIDYYLEQGEYDKATKLAAAQLAFGRNLFENNLRYKVRAQGLGAMKDALRHLGKIAKESQLDGVMQEADFNAMQADLQKWKEATDKIYQNWNKKVLAIEVVNPAKNLPNVADMIRVAKEDKDPTWRVYAARRLGYARFERTDQSNKAAINAALDELEKSSDTQVAAAAKAGRSVQDAEYHELQK